MIFAIYITSTIFFVFSWANIVILIDFDVLIPNLVSVFLYHVRKKVFHKIHFCEKRNLNFCIDIMIMYSCWIIFHWPTATGCMHLIGLSTDMWVTIKLLLVLIYIYKELPASVNKYISRRPTWLSHAWPSLRSGQINDS